MLLFFVNRIFPRPAESGIRHRFQHAPICLCRHLPAPSYHGSAAGPDLQTIADGKKSIRTRDPQPDRVRNGTVRVICRGTPGEFKRSVNPDARSRAGPAPQRRSPHHPRGSSRPVQETRWSSRAAPVLPGNSVSIRCRRNLKSGRRGGSGLF